MKWSEIVSRVREVTETMFQRGLIDVFKDANSPLDIVIVLGFEQETVFMAPVVWEPLTEALAAVEVYGLVTGTAAAQPRSISPNFLVFVTFTVATRRPANGNN